MFTLPVHDILMSYEGDSKKIAFSGDIYDGYYPDMTFLEPLTMTVTLTTGNDRVGVTLENIHTRILYHGKTYTLSIPQARENFTMPKGKARSQYTINPSNFTIDLRKFLYDTIVSGVVSNTGA